MHRLTFDPGQRRVLLLVKNKKYFFKFCNFILYHFSLFKIDKNVIILKLSSILSIEKKVLFLIIIL